MFAKILVASDGSDGARAALHLGIEMAKSLGTALHTISVEEHLPHYAASIGEVQDAKERVDEYFRKLTKEARDLALMSGVELSTAIRQGHEVETIVGYAKDGRFDLLVAGHLRTAHGPYGASPGSPLPLLGTAREVTSRGVGARPVVSAGDAMVR